ncbi:hypothetical protein ALP05_200096 [Pseudomonas caricapapayae]|uniref:Coenzyme Q-binding protein COQ10 START domain-containing protein n=1 Tax=Pseudomonas caricapapayae TaxID=46678 RepID=A0A3M6ERZ7_9PSED|nr:aromatase/cyclase [Pseudomonas caricapapayae]RMV71060.1 hypothetical protein ALP05_200096 [Pseudomonas caricapapayae]
MPEVNTSLNLGAVQLERVWTTLCEFERYPEFMEDVLDVTIEQSAGNEIISTWRVLLNGSELTWTERDLFLPDHRIVFQQIDGDLEVWSGEWSIKQVGNDISVQLDVIFDIGIPSLADVLHPIGERAIRANSRQMLEGIRDRILLSQLSKVVTEA